MSDEDLGRDSGSHDTGVDGFHSSAVAAAAGDGSPPTLRHRRPGIDGHGGGGGAGVSGAGEAANLKELQDRVHRAEKRAATARRQLALAKVVIAALSAALLASVLYVLQLSAAGRDTPPPSSTTTTSSWSSTSTSGTSSSSSSSATTGDPLPPGPLPPPTKAVVVLDPAWPFEVTNTLVDGLAANVSRRGRYADVCSDEERPSWLSECPPGLTVFQPRHFGGVVFVAPAQLAKEGRAAGEATRALLDERGWELQGVLAPLSNRLGSGIAAGAEGLLAPGEDPGSLRILFAYTGDPLALKRPSEAPAGMHHHRAVAEYAESALDTTYQLRPAFGKFNVEATLWSTGAEREEQAREDLAQLAHRLQVPFTPPS